ncbi:hypothetical protein N8590_01545 [bacterium]|nr:hypothetical protein [bacterium]MDB4793018.1 hypothetical protein [bacterium]
MKIIIQECVASSSWVYRKDQLIDTEYDENIDDAQALRWLNAGIAVAVKTPEKKSKRKATVEKIVSEAS